VENPTGDNVLTSCGDGQWTGAPTRTLAECVTAWEALGVPVTEQNEGSWSGRAPPDYPDYWVPSGCAMQIENGVGNGRLHFNSAADGQAGSGFAMACKDTTTDTDTPAPEYVCTDTVDWYNLYSSEYDCAYYVSNGWCVDGGFLAGTKEEGGTGWTSGSDFNCPEDNCCACGKGPATTCGATPP